MYIHLYIENTQTPNNILYIIQTFGPARELNSKIQAQLLHTLSLLLRDRHILSFLSSFQLLVLKHYNIRSRMVQLDAQCCDDDVPDGVPYRADWILNCIASCCVYVE